MIRTEIHFIICSILLWMFSGSAANSQQIYDSRNGSSISPHGMIRILNIYINIVYDQTPERDPLYNTDTPNWKPGDPDKLNDNVPVYLDRFLDADLNGSSPKGLMTKLFYESSLGNFIVLGDFCVVNVRQSEITPARPGANFNSGDVLRAAINTIDRLGGIKTVYGHNDINDFDRFARGAPGLEKSKGPNGKIDFMMVNIRNTYRKEENGKILYNYGNLNLGEGNSYENNICTKCKVRIGDQYYENEITNVQNVGMADNTQVYKNIAFHEFAHNLFGSNAFHTSGGNHFGTSNAAVFMGLQGGYGLMGGYNSSLVCCNAYERWRLGWIDTLSDTKKFAIAVNDENSDIARDDGSKTFYLRDFISTGDAVRIKFPCVDSGAQNQYLWLEYHRIGMNGKIDFLQYSNENDCRQKGSEGIYAFVQVGRDKLSNTDINEVFTGDDADNLRHLTAKGNWDMKLEDDYDTIMCIAWKVPKRTESYWRPNPLNGYNDLQMHIWDPTGKAALLSNKSLCDYAWSIHRNGVSEPNLCFMGDNYTAFTGKSVMDIGSNPPALNVVTSYTYEYNQNFQPAKTRINSKRIYLSGLSVEMQQTDDGTMKVDVRWDQYHLKNDVRWTGDIVLKEKLFIDEKKTLWLDQNYTPNQLKRDSTSDVFSAPSTMTCEFGSTLSVAKKSKLILDNNSSLIVKTGAVVEFAKGSRIYVSDHSQIIIEKGATLNNHKAKIVLKKGGRFVTK